jgi:hypothetical protein
MVTRHIMVASFELVVFPMAVSRVPTAGRRARWYLTGLLGLACAALTGCFSGDYNHRMDESIKKLGEMGTKANAIYATPSPINDAGGTATGITFRLPQFIPNEPTVLRAADAGSQPPFVQLPGLSYTYSLQVQEQPALVYFAAVPVAEKGADVLAQELQTAIAAAYSGAAWTDETLATPTSGSVTLKRITCTGNQVFGDKNEDGRFDLYLVSSGTHHVLIGWRAPLTATTFFEHAAIAMGSVEGKT